MSALIHEDATPQLRLHEDLLRADPRLEEAVSTAAAEAPDSPMIVLLQAADSWPPGRWSRPLSAGTPEQRRTVLIVENDDDTAFSLALLLRLYGWESEVATTPAHAIQHVRRQTFDVGLIDICLKDRHMDGIQLGVALRQLYGNHALPLIAHTGWQNDVGRAAVAGFAAYLLKPVSFAALMNVVQAVIEKRSLQQPSRLDGSGRSSIIRTFDGLVE